MKKFLVFAMVLISACMVFAAKSQINVTVTVDEKSPRVAFTSEPYKVATENGPEQISGPLTLNDITSDDLEKDRSTTVWISADTNILDPLKISVYGTALTLKNDDSYNTDETVPLTVAVETADENSTTVNHSKTFENACESASTKPTTEGFTLVEDAKNNGDNLGAAGEGFRPLTWKIKISTEKANAYAGTYEAWLWIETSVEA